MNYEINVVGLPQLIERTEAAGMSVKPLFNAGLYNSAVHIQALARAKAPHRTGNLQRSILVERGDNASRVNVNERYGLYVEQGTSPHDIYPVRKKALYWKGAPYPVKVVHHPGSRAKPYFEPAIVESLEYIRGVFIKMANRITSEMAGE